MLTWTLTLLFISGVSGCTCKTENFCAFCTSCATCYPGCYLDESGIDSCHGCSNSNCPAGNYRSGSCSGTNNGYSCVGCSNSNCPAGKYRTGTCSGTNNGYRCTDCKPIANAAAGAKYTCKSASDTRFASGADCTTGYAKKAAATSNSADQCEDDTIARFAVLEKCMERDFSGTPFASLGKLTCNDNSGLKYEVARRVWPKVELCYANKQTIKREGDFCQTKNNDKCNGGFQAQFKTSVEITPKASATGAVEKLGRNAKVLIDVDVSLALKVVSGVSVLAGGKCSHTETRFLPKVPEKISLGCFFPGCVVLLIQGKVELSLSGTLMAGATAVHHTELAAKGNIRFAKGESNPKLSYERTCGNKKNCFEYPEAKSGWRAETWGEMWGKVGVKIGPVFTVMVTPGLWASVTPWVSAEASMYGGMRYENYGGNIQISDELFGKYRIKDSKCLGGVSIPLNRSMYNTRQPSSGKTSKTNEQGQQQVQKNPNGGGASGVFFVASGDLKYCVAAALSLRVGVDIYGGLMPESFQGDVGKAKSYVKDTICGKAKSRSRNLQAASEPVSAFDKGFKDFLNPVQSNTANAGKREIDVFNKCLQEAKLEYTTNGQPTSRFFNPFNPRKYCEWGVDKVFDVISGRLDSGSIELYCRDFKYYSSETCANRVGCGASLQLVAPPARPLPVDWAARCSGAQPCKAGCPKGKVATFCRALSAKGKVVKGAAFFEGSGSDKKCVVKNGSGLKPVITCMDSARTKTTTTTTTKPTTTAAATSSGPGSGTVSCGGHKSITGCGGCPQGNGASWCKGDCEWRDDKCVGKKVTTKPKPVTTAAKKCTTPGKCNCAAGVITRTGCCDTTNGELLTYPITVGQSTTGGQKLTIPCSTAHKGYKATKDSHTGFQIACSKTAGILYLVGGSCAAHPKCQTIQDSPAAVCTTGRYNENAGDEPCSSSPCKKADAGTCCIGSPSSGGGGNNNVEGPSVVASRSGLRPLPTIATIFILVILTIMT